MHSIWNNALLCWMPWESMPIGLKNYSDGSETFVSGYEYVLDVDNLPPPLAPKSFGIPS